MGLNLADVLSESAATTFRYIHKELLIFIYSGFFILIFIGSYHNYAAYN